MQSRVENSTGVCLVFGSSDVAVCVQVAFTFSIFLAPIQFGAPKLNCGNGLNPAEREVEFHVVYSFASKSIQWIM
jgi:hypothetical protein